MTGPSPAKRLSARRARTQEIVHEWAQSLPYPQNQQVAMAEHRLVSDLNLHIELLIEAAYRTAKDD